MCLEGAQRYLQTGAALLDRRQPPFGRGLRFRGGTCLGPPRLEEPRGALLLGPGGVERLLCPGRDGGCASLIGTRRAVRLHGDGEGLIEVAQLLACVRRRRDRRRLHTRRALGCRSCLPFLTGQLEGVELCCPPRSPEWVTTVPSRSTAAEAPIVSARCASSRFSASQTPASRRATAPRASGVASTAPARSSIRRRRGRLLARLEVGCEETLTRAGAVEVRRGRPGCPRRPRRQGRPRAPRQRHPRLTHRGRGRNRPAVAPAATRTPRHARCRPRP